MAKLPGLLLKQMIKRRKKPDPFCSAVILAAGSSVRMGGVDKLTAPLAGVPALLRTLRQVEASSGVSEIILVTAPERLEELSRLAGTLELKKLARVVPGGATRAESVARGVRSVSGRADLIAAHDGARPLADPELIDAVIATAARTGAAAAAIPLRDTVKRVENGAVVGSADREQLWRMQTPQVFDADLFRAAVTMAEQGNEAFTDDVSAVQALGMTVHIVPGSERNLKLTTQEDLLLAEALLEADI